MYYKNLPLFLIGRVGTTLASVPMNDCRRNYFSDGSGNYTTSIPLPFDAYQKQLAILKMEEEEA